jgi:hypothetical protein
MEHYKVFKQIVILLFFSLVSLSSATKASYDYAVIPTQQKAQVMMRQLKPLFSDSAKFSAKGYQLIVKASATTIKEIKHVLKQIDRPLQNLIIRIANYQTLNQLLQSNELSVQVESDSNNANIQTIKKPNGAHVKITTTQRQSDRQNDKIYSARVIEGSWVYIYTGEQFPYYSYDGGYIGGNYINRPNKKRNDRPGKNYNYPIIPNTEYKEIESGFDAKAVLKNDQQVIIEIRAQNSQRDKTYQKSINTSSTNTTVSGNLNEWIEIGNRGQSYQNNGGVNYNLNRDKQEVYYIKVDVSQ